MPKTNIKSAWVMFQSQKVLAAYDEESDLWTAELTAPSVSSYPEPNHVFLMEVYAEDMAGNVAKLDSTDETYGDQLKIRVKEKSQPIATIVTPTQDSLFGKNTIEFKLRLVDVGNSGVDLDTVEFKINSQPYDNSSIEWQNSEGTYTATVTVSGLSDGNNSATLQVTDHDDNISDLASVSFIISTSAPILALEAPVEGLLTNVLSVEVKGTVSAGSEYAEITSLTINEDSVEFESGSFTKEVTLQEGENTIIVVATDKAGNSTTIRRTVNVDIHAPIISDVTAEPLIVDASGRIRVTFRVTDAQ